MTEQKARAFAERLTRIWRCEFVVSGDEEHWRFEASPNKHTEISAGTRDDNLLFLHLSLRVEGMTDSASFRFMPNFGVLEFVDDRTTSALGPLGTRRVQLWADFWKPIFRRNCWLSGLPIEVSAHEQLEWMQTWNGDEMQACPAIELPEPLPIIFTPLLFISNEEVERQARHFAVSCGCSPDVPIQFWGLDTGGPGAEFCYNTQEEKYGTIMFRRPKPNRMCVYQKEEEGDPYLYTDPEG